MIPRICELKYLEEFRVWIKFEDDSEGIVDLKDELWGEVFEPLLDPALFSQVRLDPELNTLIWENGADFSPEFLYEQIHN